MRTTVLPRKIENNDEKCEERETFKRGGRKRRQMISLEHDSYVSNANSEIPSSGSCSNWNEEDTVKKNSTNRNSSRARKRFVTFQAERQLDSSEFAAFGTNNKHSFQLNTKGQYARKRSKKIKEEQNVMDCDQEREMQSIFRPNSTRQTNNCEDSVEENVSHQCYSLAKDNHLNERDQVVVKREKPDVCYQDPAQVVSNCSPVKAIPRTDSSEDSCDGSLLVIEKCYSLPTGSLNKDDRVVVEHEKLDIFDHNFGNQIPDSSGRNVEASVMIQEASNLSNPIFVRKRNKKCKTEDADDTKPFICQRCGQCFNTENFLENLYQRDYELRLHNLFKYGYFDDNFGKVAKTCNKCKKELVHHSRSKKVCNSQSCSCCPTQSIDEFPFEMHNPKTESEGRSICDECGKNFSTKFNLRIHKKVHAGEKKFSCPHCSKPFRTQQQLNNHVRIHSGEKPYDCNYCNKLFTTKQQLIVHCKVHTGEKPFGCTRCTKHFLTKQQLQIHTRTHTGEKPYSCEHCEKNFRTKQQLDVHKRIHVGKKPFSCMDCGKKYSTEQQLIVHMKAHAGEKSFSCYLCEKQFLTKQQLSNHIAIHS